MGFIQILGKAGAGNKYGIRLFILFLISFLFSSNYFPSTVINYVQLTSSPDHLLELIVIPESDANSTDGYLFIRSKKRPGTKMVRSFKNLNQHVFVISNDGKIV